MPGLFDPDRHEALPAGLRWDAARAERFVAGVCAEVGELVATSSATWPVHPRDVATLGVDVPLHGLFGGLAGTVVGLTALSSELPAPTLIDAARDAWRALRDAPDFAAPSGSGWLGLPGAALAAAVQGGPVEVAAVCAALDELLESPERFDGMRGLPGALRVALALRSRSGSDDDHLAGCIRRTSAALWDQWLGHRGVREGFSGEPVRVLGAGHGSVGALGAVRAAASAGFGPVDLSEVDAALTALVVDTVHAVSGQANWPAAIGADTDPMLLQWAHGAPGVVIEAATLPAAPDGRLREILAAAAESIWLAGPQLGDPGIAYGTAGGALGLLSWHLATGELGALNRARLLGAAAMRQVERARRAPGGDGEGRAHPGLWTGDVGVALVVDALERPRTIRPAVASILALGGFTGVPAP